MGKRVWHGWLMEKCPLGWWGNRLKGGSGEDLGNAPRWQWPFELPPTSCTPSLDCAFSKGIVLKQVSEKIVLIDGKNTEYFICGHMGRNLGQYHLEALFRSVPICWTR